MLKRLKLNSQIIVITKKKFGEAHPRTIDKLLEIANLIPKEWIADKDTALSKFVASAQLINDLRKKNE